MQQQYSCDLTEAFPVQLVTFAASLRSQIITFVITVQQVAHLLSVEYSAMASAFTDVVTALILFLTLPDYPLRLPAQSVHSLSYA